MNMRRLINREGGEQERRRKALRMDATRSLGGRVNDRSCHAEWQSSGQMKHDNQRVLERLRLGVRVKSAAARTPEDECDF